MSINAISSVSLYEYYYKINKDDQENKKSPLEKEMREYGLTPTDNEIINIQLLQKAKSLDGKEQEKKEVSYSDRPWADLMYQLNITFNEDPKDDIEDIKDELALLVRDMNDDELNKEIRDLEDYVDRLYINFQQNQSSSFSKAISVDMQLNNLAMMNQAYLL